MNAVLPDLSTREQILGAAHQRFRRYGYNKTTMAEIAGDCHMSAANLYRYFENKQDIAAHLVAQCLRQEEVHLESVAGAAELPPAEGLRRYITETLACTYERCASDPLINQVVEAIGRERRDVIDSHTKVKLGQIAALLERGIASGEFDAVDVRETAEAILAATVLFDVPLLVQMYAKEELERVALAVSRLVLRSVERRPQCPPARASDHQSKLMQNAFEE
jgi:AcrR family transcriptional regulator